MKNLAKRLATSVASGVMSGFAFTVGSHMARELIAKVAKPEKKLPTKCCARVCTDK